MKKILGSMLLIGLIAYSTLIVGGVAVLTARELAQIIASHPLMIVPLLSPAIAAIILKCMIRATTDPYESVERKEKSSTMVWCLVTASCISMFATAATHYAWKTHAGTPVKQFARIKSADIETFPTIKESHARRMW